MKSLGGCRYVEQSTYFFIVLSFLFHKIDKMECFRRVLLKFYQKDNFNWKKYVVLVERKNGLNKMSKARAFKILHVKGSNLAITYAI